MNPAFRIAIALVVSIRIKIGFVNFPKIVWRVRGTWLLKRPQHTVRHRQFSLITMTVKWTSWRSNHRSFNCLFNSYRGTTSKGTSLSVFCEGNPLVTVEFPHKGPITRKRFPCHDAYCEVSQGSAHPYGSGMVAPKELQCSFDEMAIWAGEILKSIKSELHLKLVYCSRSTTHFISLTKVINSLLGFFWKINVKKCEIDWLVAHLFHSD